MPRDALILTSGGYKGLVAAATLGKAARPIMLFVHDGRPSAAEHHQAFCGQAQHFEAARRIELVMSHLFSGEGEQLRITPLARFQLLTAAAGQAAKAGASRLVWPVCVGDDFDALAQITEAMVLIEHAAEVESGHALRVEAPLVDLTDEQVIELGAKLAVPWRLARACTRRAAKPCGACAACRRWQQAFAAAGVEMPAPSAAAP